MQAQVAFVAQSGIQLHAAPPGAPSSQYQPLRQKPAPHAKQVPFSQLFAGAVVSVASVDSESEPSSSEPARSAVLEEASAVSSGP